MMKTKSTIDGDGARTVGGEPAAPTAERTAERPTAVTGTMLPRQTGEELTGLEILLSNMVSLFCDRRLNQDIHPIGKRGREDADSSARRAASRCPPGRRPRPPKEHEFRAFLMSYVLGSRLTEIAKTLQQHGCQRSEGEVSRMISRVRAFLEELGISLPSARVTVKVVALDPGDLDEGARVDALTPRQRAKRIDEEAW
jgi:hypothetical protein